MELEEVTSKLQNLARILSDDVPDSTWYLFGSITRRDPLPSDVDVLIVYENDADAIMLRQGLANLSHFLPLHVLLLRRDEEKELHFIQEQSAWRIFPS